jgi:hypothetical protein
MAVAAWYYGVWADQVGILEALNDSRRDSSVRVRGEGG